MHKTYYMLMTYIIITVTSMSDLQPSTAIANQLPSQLTGLYANYSHIHINSS